jgi:4-hydroxy-tetrahydrodipicolinate synthase
VSKIEKFEGSLPSACVPFTDKTCKTIDEDALRVHYRFLLKHDLGALVVGGHMGEMPFLSEAENKRVVQIAHDEAHGKKLIIGGVVADSTRVAIEQGLAVKEAGGDAVLFTSPVIFGWSMTDDDRGMVEHFVKFDKEVNIPFILMASPAGGVHGVALPTIIKLAQRIENFVGMKILCGNWNTGAFKTCTATLKSVRDIGCLNAGSSNLFGTMLVGGDGNLSGAGNFMVEQDITLIKAFNTGDLAKAREIADRYQPVTDVLDGSIGLPKFYFHYRFKIAAWLMGLIPTPYMRLPQMPPPKKDIELLRQAMIKAGFPVVHEAVDLEIADV